jgi:hypothetical protein
MRFHHRSMQNAQSMYLAPVRMDPRSRCRAKGHTGPCEMARSMPNLWLLQIVQVCVRHEPMQVAKSMPSLWIGAGGLVWRLDGRRGVPDRIDDESAATTTREWSGTGCGTTKVQGQATKHDVACTTTKIENVRAYGSTGAMANVHSSSFNAGGGRPGRGGCSHLISNLAEGSPEIGASVGKRYQYLPEAPISGLRQDPGKSKRACHLHANSSLQSHALSRPHDTQAHGPHSTALASSGVSASRASGPASRDRRPDRVRRAVLSG